MILKSYLFCQTSGRYQQYTNDQSETLLKPLCRTCAMNHQIAIHRSGNLMYYAYTYKKSESEIYGLCVVCGEICLNLQKLYEFFLQTLESMARKGILFRYDEQGCIQKNFNNLFDETAEIDSAFREIKNYLDKRNTYWDVLPPEDLSIPLTGKIAFAFNEDDKNKITEGIKHYHNVIVTMDNIAPSSFARTVERINAEKRQLSNEKETLEKEIVSLSKQKKQYRWVAFLSIAVIASLIGLYFLNDNLSGIISDQSDTIKNLETTISDKDSHITSLRDTLSIERRTIQERDETIRELNSSLQSIEEQLSSLKETFPIEITSVKIGNTYRGGNIETDYGNTIFSNYTMYLTPQITYIGIDIEETITLKVKWYTPDGNLSRGTSSPNGCSFESLLYIESGTNTQTLSGWGNETKGHWGSGDYRIEIWYEDVCLKAKNLTIY